VTPMCAMDALSHSATMKQRVLLSGFGSTSDINRRALPNTQSRHRAPEL
jgi:hypothetical protein